MKRFSAILLMILVAGILQGYARMDTARLMRFPAIHGNQVVFSYAGDLYTVDATGGMARRITSHKGYEMFPRFSPDGSKIAFTAQYDGNTEVYVMPSEGGKPERLTYTATLDRDDVADRMGPNNIVMTWTNDGQHIIFRSRNKSFNAFQGDLYKVSVDGGMPEQLPLPKGGFCSYSPDGKKLAYNRVFREFRTWKHYRGGMADDVWIHDFETHETKAITNHDGQDIIPMWKDQSIYFVSDRDWRMNLYRYDINTEEISRLTNFEKFDVKFPSMGKDHLVFENGGYLYKMDLQSHETTRIPVTIANDQLASRHELIDASEHIRGAALSPHGKRLVFGARGDIFNVPAKNGITYNLTRSSGHHDRNPVWSPNGQHIAYISDKSGEFEIYIEKQPDDEQAKQLTHDSKNYKYQLNWSPDSKKILWNNSEFELKYVNIQTGETTMVDSSRFGDIQNFNWSPDSQWITYSKQSDNDMSVVWVYNTNTGEQFPVTDSWYSSSNASFSSDGKYIVVGSQRTFDPIYSWVEWNYAYNDMEKIYLITLEKSTPSPFAPENDQVDTGDQQADENEKTGQEAVKVQIDRDGIRQRIIPLPIEASSYSNIHAIGTKVYYNQYNSNNGGSKLKMFDLEKKEETTLGENMQFSISPANDKMLVKQNNRYAVMDLPSSSIEMKKTVDLSNMKVQVDRKEEWRQIFNESWRQFRDFFYVENMHGVDWDQMKQRYSELLPYVNHRNDLTYVIGLMIAETNVGHAYIQSGDRPEPERIKTGLLGARVEKHASGYFQIQMILEGANWSKELHAPLNAVGVDVDEGDFILEINGQSVQKTRDLYSMLVGKANEQVEIRVNDRPTLDGSHTEMITTRGDESELYYYRWVQQNIDNVNEKTNGQVGYIHIPDMITHGLNEFVEHFYPQLDKKALIIDDRGNGGGNVSPMIIERLRRKITRANMRRNAEEPSQTPSEMMRGPMVLLIDRYSASDGDLFAHSFKKHKLGTVIGTRTWGGVVGITGSLPFIDGGSLRIPQFASYSGEKSEWIIEGKGVEPDITVENDPWKEYQGIDEQLNKAIEVILKKIEEEYKPLPNIPEAPDKSK
jgi:tricorn protease